MQASRAGVISALKHEITIRESKIAAIAKAEEEVG